MTIALLRPIARLPLPVLHACGAVLGWCAYLVPGRYSSRLRDNLAQSGIAKTPAEFRTLVRQSAREAGRAALETLAIWLRPTAAVLGLVRRQRGWELVEAARARGKGIVFISPHLGAFEIANLFIAARIPLTFLYSPPRARRLEPLMNAGRQRDGATGASATMAGVKRLLKVLREGGAIGILPDQVPGKGDGVWVDFFGRPAYTMTLIARLMKATDAAAILVCVRRLPRSRGYEVDMYDFDPGPLDQPEAVTARLNRAVETLILTCPAQYLWSYNRYKVPAGASPP